MSVVPYSERGLTLQALPVPEHFETCLYCSYSIEQSVGDLMVVLDTLSISNNNDDNKYKKVHLLGHSYGGCLAYEFAKQHPECVQSLILSNAPTNMKVAGQAYDRLTLQNPLTFWKQHVCQISNTPALDDAMKHVGSVWATMDVVQDYVALPPSSPPSSSFPFQTLVINCPKDFAFESARGWKDVLASSAQEDNKEHVVEEVLLEQCAHYPHLEDGPAYGRILDTFLASTDGS